MSQCRNVLRANCRRAFAGPWICSADDRAVAPQKLVQAALCVGLPAAPPEIVHRVRIVQRAEDLRLTPRVEPE